MKSRIPIRPSVVTVRLTSQCPTGGEGGRAIAEIAAAFVSIAPSAQGFGSKLNSQVGGQVKSSGTSLGRTFGRLFVLGAGVIAAAGIGSLLKGSIEEAREAQKVGAATEQIIKATGGAAKITAGQVGDLTTAISLKTGIDDEAIQTGANLLLTFKNVRNEAGKGAAIFDRATQSAVDLSAAGFGSVDSASKSLGKALNDPLKGITALGRAGVTFTEAQKEQIKGFTESGDLLSAQKIILSEVESQVGGVAAATATSGEKAKVAFGNIKESIGTALLPLIDTLARQFLRITPAIQRGIAGVGPLFQRLRAFLQPFIASIAATVAGLARDLAPVIVSIGSAVATFVGQIQSGTGAGGAFASVVQGLASALSAVFGFISANQAVVGTFVGIIIAAAAAARVFAAAQLLVNLALAANPIGIVVVALAAVAAGLVYAYKHSETFRNAVDALGRVFKKVFDGIRKAVTVVLSFIKAHWRTIIVILGGPIGLAVALISKHWDKIKAGAQIVIDWVKRNWPALKALVTGPFETAKNVIGKVWTALRQGASRVKEVVTKVFSAIASAIQSAIDKVQTLIDKLRQVKGGGGAKRSSPLGPGANDREVGRSVVGGLVQGIDSQRKAVVDAVDRVAKGAGKKLKEKLEGVRDALKDQLAGLKDDFANIRDSVAETFTGDLFSAPSDGPLTANQFIVNLLNTRGKLEQLVGAFKTLSGYGLQPGFLTQLFQQPGGAGLILELAGNQALATNAGQLFGSVTSLSNTLGANVAQNQVGDKITETNTQLAEVNKKLEKLIKAAKDGPKETGREINNTAGKGHRRGKRR